MGILDEATTILKEKSKTSKKWKTILIISLIVVAIVLIFKFLVPKINNERVRSFYLPRVRY